MKDDINVKTPFTYPSKSLRFKLTISVAATLLFTFGTWAFFNIRYHKERIMDNIFQGAERIGDTIKLGTHYAMMHNSRNDINQIINNIARHKDIISIRIYNKDGQIKFSSEEGEVDRFTDIKAQACDVCHRTTPPRINVSISDRVRVFSEKEGGSRLGIICSIPNEQSCYEASCHVHPSDKKILGALDVVFSLKIMEEEIFHYKEGLLGLAGILFLVTGATIFMIVFQFVNKPIQKLIRGTRSIAGGNYDFSVQINQMDEMGELAQAINKMCAEIGRKQAELDRQRREYQDLFEQVPCLITVQDKNYRLLRYNREFAEIFAPHPFDYCYAAYKGYEKKCDFCPVEKTFQDGRSHYGEQTGMNKDGTKTYWVTKTQPIRDENGNVTLAMELSLDITHLKLLEDRLVRTERKYKSIFNHIPNPVFVLDLATLTILDCNQKVKSVYGYDKDDIINSSFLQFFRSEERDDAAFAVATKNKILRAGHITRSGKVIIVNIHISPSEFEGRKVYLLTTSDITKSLETEQQLIQASKLATLGEMASGIAHELNQPLSVIETASSFLIKKIKKNEPVNEAILYKMLFKIDGNVFRASNIINHMREFARKSDHRTEKVRLNDILTKAFEIFNQQLKSRGIEVVWRLCDDLPFIKAEPNRLEQVFINLLLNARDAIEDKWELHSAREGGRITLTTRMEGRLVAAEVCDTGCGFSENIREKLFEPFFTTKEVGKGTGLGLSISYGIVKECGGGIRAENRTEGGACFITTFPVAYGENSEAISSIKKEEANGQHHTSCG